jgi:hypothetical protein
MNERERETFTQAHTHARQHTACTHTTPFAINQTRRNATSGVPALKYLRTRVVIAVTQQHRVKQTRRARNGRVMGTRQVRSIRGNRNHSKLVTPR